MSWALAYTVHLRKQVHAALARDDLKAAIKLNKVADEAYRKLSADDQCLYGDWWRGAVKGALVVLDYATDKTFGERGTS